ncbi:class I adenylate-forming enzyme family protein [Nocardioides daejeonensis]|uniref:class I adenylate-forming enzyme family protein n=1 Tax=Nocardioides daejeonensis TaxID=1046556 RepID=UPI000D744B63|nr:AMP-binding protein [Nocardioides daejeonensis]
MSTVNLSRMLLRNARRFPDAEALVFEGRRWSHGDLDRDVNALAATLHARGLGRDTRVAVVANNVPEYLVLALALAKLGGVLVPLNYRLTGGELAQLIGHAGVHAVATVPEFAPVTAEALELASLDVERLALEPIDGWQSVRAMIQQGQGQRVADVEVEADDLQRVVYTSGTTSLPKGVRLSHGNVNANMHVHVLELGLTPQERLLVFAPLYHVGGTDIPGFAVWHAGGCLVLQRRFDPTAVLGVIGEERVTGMVLGATMLDMLRRAAESATQPPELGSMRWIIYSQVTRPLHAVARDLFPAARLIEGYGLTETCSALTYMDAGHAESKQGSVGTPVAWVDVRVVDEDDNEVPPGVPGEVVARGPKVSSGYLDDDDATAVAFRGGWFHTGDVGIIDEDGFLFIRDRLKDMIRSGGENIASAEIEAALAEHPDVLAVSVVGAPHPVWVEVPVAFVIGRPQLRVDDLVAHARQHLGGYKQPKEFYLVDEFPTNASGKVLKRSLREMQPDLEPAWTYA